MLVDGRPVRSCLMFAVSAQDSEITTVEGLTEKDGSLGPVQQAFLECHGLQCGFCTPGFLTTITAGLRDNPDADARGGPRHDRGQPVPLHRLPEHRQGGRAGRRDRPRRRTSTSQPPEPPEPEAGQVEFEDRADDNASTGLGA